MSLATVVRGAHDNRAASLLGIYTTRCTGTGRGGLETFLPACITHLIEPGILTWPQMIAKMTTGPAEVLGIDRGTLIPGAIADVTVIDPKVCWTVNASEFKSKSRNTPWHGSTMTGRAACTIVCGQVKYDTLG